MEDVKYTKGKWCAEFGEAYRVRSQDDGGQISIMMNLKGAHGLDGRRSGDEVAANAHLISAAPDQHEALIATQALLERLGLESSDEYSRNAAAIAKALGK